MGKEKVEEIVAKIKKRKKNLKFILAGTDGFLLASGFPLEINSRMLAALAAAVFKSSVINSRELKIGSFSYALIKATNGFFVCFEVSPSIILGCILSKMGLNKALSESTKLRKIFI
ncbi:MAG: roadblock/LC7 domain-containing protein [Candidatus Aenigmatarchaeota archaeon]